MEQDISRPVRAGENKSNIEAEVELDDPTEMGDDVISSEDEEGWEVIATSVKHRELTATSAGGGREAKRHDIAPVPRKHATSSNAIGEQEAKWTLLPCPLEASLA